jgi:hypothetical protein
MSIYLWRKGKRTELKIESIAAKFQKFAMQLQNLQISVRITHISG